jgi:Flp pilus assembly pilin Flp
MNAFWRMLLDESGTAMTEYAIILTLLSVAATAALVTISNELNGSINEVSTNMQTYELTTPP